MTMVIPFKYFLTLNSGKEITVRRKPAVSGGRCSYGWQRRKSPLYPHPYYKLCKKIIWVFIIYKVKDYETKS